MPWVATPDIALRYEISGEGSQVLLLLHEMGGCLESWDRLLPLLHPHFRVLRHDQRNAGLSEKPPGPMTLVQSGHDAVALLDALGLTDPVVVMGTAVGGAVALHMAAAHPGRVRAAIVTSPATGLPEAARAATLERAALLEREGTRAVVDAGLAQAWPEVLRGDVTHPAAGRFAATRAQRLAADAYGWAATLRMLAGLDMAADLASIACPVLVLAGAHDHTRPPDRVAPVAAAIRGAVFRTVESGHFMAIQTPELLAAEVLGFFADQ